MVGDYQAAWLDASQCGVEPDTENVEQLSRPALLEPETSRIADTRISGCDGAASPNQVKKQPEQSERTVGAGCGLQSFFPMKWRA